MVANLTFEPNLIMNVRGVHSYCRGVQRLGWRRANGDEWRCMLSSRSAKRGKRVVVNDGMTVAELAGSLQTSPREPFMRRAQVLQSVHKP